MAIFNKVDYSTWYE